MADKFCSAVDEALQQEQQEQQGALLQQHCSYCIAARLTHTSHGRL